MSEIAVIGTAGLPAAYGGFETLAANLAARNRALGSPHALTVYCTSRGRADRPDTYLGARLRYLPLPAHGPLSVLYDALSLFLAARRGARSILLLGVSGAVALPLIRRFSAARIVVNIDGLEWKRAKWGPVARRFLRWSERLAVRHAHSVVADNRAIVEHVEEEYGRWAHLIAYGGDHALQAPAVPWSGPPLPRRYALAICRIEPENNCGLILRAFARKPGLPLVFVGNWQASAHGRALRRRYGAVPGLHLLDPIHDTGRLRTLREGASLYVHGHSAGGTNPSLVEAMHFGLPVLAYDCAFNRHSTEGAARYFADAGGLAALAGRLAPVEAALVGAAMRALARRRYLWADVAAAYFGLLAPHAAPLTEAARAAESGHEQKGNTRVAARPGAEAAAAPAAAPGARRPAA